MCRDQAPGSPPFDAGAGAMNDTVRKLLAEALGTMRWTDHQLFDFMFEHPILMNRPIVVTPLGVRLCRPSEAVLEILASLPLAPFTKEDREVVIGPGARRV